MVALGKLRIGGDRFAHVDLAHPVRRLFGPSRGVTLGVVFVLAVTSMMLVRPLIMSGLSWHRTAGLLAERRVEVAALQRRNDHLTEQVTYFHTASFVAEQARVYGMIEPGEEAFVMRELVHPESAAQYAIARVRNATVDAPVALTGGATASTR